MKYQPITAIIVDDERPSREVLLNYLLEYCPEIEVVKECSSAESAYTAIIAYKPQLVFLDVEMPKGNGIDLLKKLQNNDVKIDFKVIFTTAFSDYAIQAFRLSAVDYLLKPIKIGELTEAVRKAEQMLLNGNPMLNLQTLIENVQELDLSSQKLVIADSKGFKVVRTSDIILCEANGYCTQFHIKGNCLLSSSRNLKYYEELLPAASFLRVHNSFIVNLQHVSGYSHNEEIILTDNRKCPLSLTYKKKFLLFFKQYK